MRLRTLLPPLAVAALAMLTWPAGDVVTPEQAKTSQPGEEKIAPPSQRAATQVRLAPRTQTPRIAAATQPAPAPLRNARPGVVRIAELVTASGPIAVAEGEILIRFVASMSSAARAELYRMHGAVPLQSSMDGVTERIAISPERDLGAAITALRQDPRVLDAGPNAIATASARDDDDDDDASACSGVGCLQYHLRNDAAAATWESAWDAELVGEGIVVAILDTGLRQVPDLAHVPLLPGWDFVNDDPDPLDDHNHGTLIASIIATDSSHSAGGAEGTARGATLLPIKVLDAHKVGTELMIADGIRYAVDHGAQVINLSLSFPAGYIPSRLLSSAVSYAAAQGVVLVGASGNTGSRIVSYPAAFPEVIAVGASRMDRGCSSCGHRDGAVPGHAKSGKARHKVKRADYSNRGAALDFLAPGGDFSRDKNHDGVPDGIIAQAFSPDAPDQGAYWVAAGTSFAAAQVSALAAVMLEAGAEAGQVRDLMVQHTLESPGGGFNTDVGAGAVCPALAVDAAEEAEDLWVPEVYVNQVVAVSIIRWDGRQRAMAAVQVVDAWGYPIDHARVYGQWLMPVLEGADCRTDWEGFCSIATDPFMPSSQGTLAAFRVDRVVVNGQPVTPRSFYRMDRHTAGQLTAAGSGLGASSIVTFSLQPSSAWHGVFPYPFQTTRMLRAIGSGLGSSSLALGFDMRFHSQVFVPNLGGAFALGSGLGSSSLQLNIPWQPQFFLPWSGHFAPHAFGVGSDAAELVTLSAAGLSSPGDAEYWSAFGSGLGASSLRYDFGSVLFLPRRNIALLGFGVAEQGMALGSGTGEAALDGFIEANP